MTGHITSPGCPSLWTRPQRGTFLLLPPRGCTHKENLGRNWTCSHQSIRPASRRPPLERATNPQRHHDYSLVPGFRHRDHQQTIPVRPWRKLLGNSFSPNPPWLPMNLRWRRPRKMHRAHPSPQLHRRQRKTRSGGRARSCESRLGYLIPLPPHTLTH